MYNAAYAQTSNALMCFSFNASQSRGNFNWTRKQDIAMYLLCPITVSCPTSISFCSEFVKQRSTALGKREERNEPLRKDETAIQVLKK